MAERRGNNSFASPSLLDLFSDFIHSTSNEDLTSIDKILKIPQFDINFQDSNGDSLLHHCTSFGKYDIVKKLLGRGAKVNICNIKGETPLIIASCIENLEICYLLIRYNANINHADNGGLTALHWAVMRGSTQVVKFLISYKANINCRDKAGNTPLHLSALYEYLEITKLLLKNHAEKNVKTLNGTTPLHHACEKGNIGITQLLLKKVCCFVCYETNSVIHQYGNKQKIEINAQDESGFSCLHLAVKSGKISLVKLLLENGADQTIQNFDGKSPVAFADSVEMKRVFYTASKDYKSPRSTPYEDWVYVSNDDNNNAPNSPKSCEDVVKNLFKGLDIRHNKSVKKEKSILDLPTLAPEGSPELVDAIQPPYFQPTQAPLTPIPIAPKPTPNFISPIRSAFNEEEKLFPKNNNNNNNDQSNIVIQDTQNQFGPIKKCTLSNFNLHNFDELLSDNNPFPVNILKTNNNNYNNNNNNNNTKQSDSDFLEEIIGSPPKSTNPISELEKILGIPIDDKSRGSSVNNSRRGSIDISDLDQNSYSNIRRNSIDYSDLGQNNLFFNNNLSDEKLSSKKTFTDLDLNRKIFPETNVNNNINNTLQTRTALHNNGFNNFSTAPVTDNISIIPNKNVIIDNVPIGNTPLHTNFDTLIPDSINIAPLNGTLAIDPILTQDGLSKSLPFAHEGKKEEFLRDSRIVSSGIPFNSTLNVINSHVLSEPSSINFMPQTTNPHTEPSCIPTFSNTPQTTIVNNYILNTATSSSSDKIIEFFTTIGLTKYIKEFIDEEWDWESLLEVTNEDLQEMGIKVGSRRKILNAIQKYKSSKDDDGSLRHSGNKDGREFWDIDFSTLTLIDFLGNGFYGSVYKGSWNNVEVAIKKLTKLESFDYDKWMLEVRLLLELRHPNIVTCYCACTQFPNYCIVLEYLHRGSLYKVLKDKSIEIDYKRKLIFAIDCAKGMLYLHDRTPPIIHRDLKSDNLLVTEDWHVKVSDFGLSRLKDLTYSYTQPTSPFDVTITSPEVLTKNHISEKADVYSFGLLLWELLTRSRPFDGMNPHWVAQSVINEELRPPINESDNWPVQYLTLMKECWAQDHRFRPSFKEILLKLELLYKLEVHPETVVVLPSEGYV